MYRLAGSGVHKKHNTHQSTSGPLPCTIEAIIRSGTGTHPPARPTRPFSPNVGEEEFCELRLLGILGSWTSTFRSSKKFAKNNALNGTKFIRNSSLSITLQPSCGQRTPREGAGQLPALLLDQGQLPKSAFPICHRDEGSPKKAVDSSSAEEGAGLPEA